MSSQRNSFSETSIRSKIDKAQRKSSVGGASSRSSLPLSPTADMVRGPSANPSPTKPPRASRNASLALPPVTNTAPAALQPVELDVSAGAIVAPPSPVTPSLRRVARPTMRGDGAEDVFSRREKDFIHEVNTLRTNPAGYAAHMRTRMELYEPFISHTRMNFGELEAFAQSMSARKVELTQLLSGVDSEEKTEVQSLQSQWSVEDVERAKRAKKGGGAAGKKRNSGVVDEGEFILEERAGILKELAERHASTRQELQGELESVSDKLHRSSHGVKLLKQCLRLVAAVPPREPVTYSRGLSLGARDACCDGIRSLFTASRYTAAYGQGDSFSTACFVGEEDVPQTIMEMLLGLQDPEKRSREALLSPGATTVGCGWREDLVGECCTCLILARHFEELRAIADRDHLPLLQVKHVLHVAQAESPGSVVTLAPRSGVTLVQPQHHPFECGNVARLLFKCDGSISLYGVLYNILDDEPTHPSYGVGRFLCQRVDSDHTELRLLIPHKGEFGVIIFSRNGATPEPRSVGEGFVKIGKVLLRATQFDVTFPITSFPTTSGDFDNRKGLLLSPMNGMLPPSSIQTFHVRIPHSNYLRRELDAVQSELAAVDVKMGRSDVDLQQLTSAVDAASKEVDEQESQTKWRALSDEIAQLQRDVPRKRGKELEKLKAVLADLEEQRGVLQAASSAARERLSNAQAQVDAFRRTARQVEAHHRRLMREQAELEHSADRSAPLTVELSVEGKKALLPEVPETNGCEYRVRLRTPPSGSVALFVNGLLALTWAVGDGL